MNTQQNECCRWLIDATFELASPMHLGTGKDVVEHVDNKDRWFAELSIDASGKPTIPGASFKGALRAFAQQTQQIEALKSVFGEAVGEKTTAGHAEFRYGHCQEINGEIEKQPHVAIDRVTGTAMDKKLFHTPRVLAGTKFTFRIVLHKSTREEVTSLLALLQSINTEAGFTLGAQASKDQGRAHLFGACTVHKFGREEAKKWLENPEAGSWEKHATQVEDIKVETKPISNSQAHLQLSLAFNSPFLVKKGVEKNQAGHDETVPMMQGDRVLLPASSLRGRLRSQAERILRTLGIDTPQGHDPTPWRRGDPHTDLAAFLFGSAGWRGIVTTSDCLDQKKLKPVPHEMVAIDRFTGGGKDGAKFAVKVAECPTLAGSLRFDLTRLKKAEEAAWPALGLFTLLLRDLAEGDISFGYGISKGFGQCKEEQILAAWKKLLEEHFPEQAAPTEYALAALRQSAKAKAEASQPLEIAELEHEKFKPIRASSGFLNPYHFIPLSKPDTATWTSSEQLKEERGHDRYHGLSGRITCQLTTKTPMFIGARRKEGDTEEPASLDGYKFQGKRAIPATSLRGMISSLFESVSGSGFRVLDPSFYSMRKSNKKALSAMGRIVLNDDKTGYMLQPCTLPTLDKRGANSFSIPVKWRRIPSFTDHVRLKMYFDDDWGKYPANQRYFMKLPKISHNNGAISPSDQLRYPSSNQITRFLIGLRNTVGQRPISREEFEELRKRLTVAEQLEYVAGYVRSLPTGERLPGTNPSCLLPDGIKHYAFIPIWDNGTKLDATDAINQFHALSDMAFKSMNLKQGEFVDDAKLLPYVPAGRQPGSDRQATTKEQPYGTRLRSGDIVFFDIDDSGKVSEISFSSMWRTGIKKPGSTELATTGGLLAQYDPNLLPLGMGKRQPLFSPVDLLFGAVEYREPGEKKTIPQSADKKQAMALAGRVSISIGLADAEKVKTEPAITLKELSSPKPPSPALYFKPTQGDGYVSKTNLAESSSNFTLRGRKTYLHAWRDEQDKVVRLDDSGTTNNQRGRDPWTSKYHGQQDAGNKRRVKVEPISAGQTFTFHIDFHNLNERELQQLCATLQPAPEFEHRLGMGKPLGLGSVKIKISSLELVDRMTRYSSDDLSEKHNHQSLTTDEITSLAAAGMKIADPNVCRALQLLGNPYAIGVPVHYPQRANGMLENEHFKWFMANDNDADNAPDGNRQGLKMITQNDVSLIGLNRL